MRSLRSSVFLVVHVTGRDTRKSPHAGKLETTREKRLGQMLSELKNGKTYMNMAWSENRSRR